MSEGSLKKIIILLLIILLPFKWCLDDKACLNGISLVKAGELTDQDVSSEGLPVGNDDKERGNREVPAIHVPSLKTKKVFLRDAQRFCAGKRIYVNRLGRQSYEKCMEKQRIGYSSLEKLNEKYTDKAFYSDMIYPYCLNKWTKDEMTDTFKMSNCLKKEIQGIQQVLEYQKKYNKDKVVEIVEKALIRYGSWYRAAFKVRRYFE